MRSFHKKDISIIDNEWDAWIFDLDDTLLDTSALLIPEAFKNACEFLFQEKMLSSVDLGLEIWSKRRSQISTLEIIQHIIHQHHPPLDEAKEKWMVQKAYQIFRTPVVPSVLELMPGGRELLEQLQNKFNLFLVTQGDIQTQIKKVMALRMTHFFKHIYYVDPFSGESKLQAFQDILRRFQYPPERILTIGNRRDNEIACGKRLGMKTCFMAHGEHKNEPPQSLEQHADYSIRSLLELPKLILEHTEVRGMKS